MHILHFCPHSGGVMYEWHQVHFIDELERAGHVVTDCNPVLELGRQTTAAENSEVLIEAARKILRTPGPYMLLAATATDKNIEASAIDYIRSLGIPCVNLSVDDMVAHYLVRNIGSHFDLHWTTFLSAEKKLHKYRCRVIYQPMAANPYFFKGYNLRTHTLCFVGSCYGARGTYVKKLVQAGLPLRVRGNGWKTNSLLFNQPIRNTGWHFNTAKLRTFAEYALTKEGRKIIAGGIKKGIIGKKEELIDLSVTKVDSSGPASFQDMKALFADSTMSLGILEVANTHLLDSPLYLYRLREFEATMIGCAHIVYKVPELENCYDEDKEIIFYSSLNECIDKASFYLATERYDICRTIGTNARKRAEAEHTWMHRFKVIWKELGI